MSQQTNDKTKSFEHKSTTSNILTEQLRNCNTNDWTPQQISFRYVFNSSNQNIGTSFNWYHYEIIFVLFFIGGGKWPNHFTEAKKRQSSETDRHISRRKEKGPSIR